MVEVKKIMLTSSKGPMHALPHSVTQTLQQATTDPYLCRRQRHNIICEWKKRVMITIFSFCDCVFQSVCSLMEKDKRLMEASR